MSIEGAVVGLFMIMSGEVDTLTTLKYANKVYQKAEAGTWDNSWHEESHTLLNNMLTGNQCLGCHSRRSALEN